MRNSMRRDRVLREAWLGDAVLCLYARPRILRDSGGIDAAKCSRMTSNQFLGALGEASEVEAELGRVYAADGLEAAFHWIEAQLMPLFERQENKRERAAGRPIRSSPRGSPGAA